MGRAGLRAEEFIAAAEKGDVKRLRRLLDGGLKVDVRDSRLGPGWTALMAAAGRGRTEAFELLLQRGADPHATDDDGNTLLHHAAYGGKEPILRAILALGLDVNRRNRRGYTPLILAAMDERIRAVRCLLEAGADVNVQTNDQYSMTALKAGRQNEKIAALLHKAGARMDPRQERVVAQACARVADVSAGDEPELPHARWAEAVDARTGRSVWRRRFVSADRPLLGPWAASVAGDSVLVCADGSRLIGLRPYTHQPSPKPAKTSNDEASINCGNPFSASFPKSRPADLSSRKACNHGHAGVPAKPSRTAKTASRASGIVMAAGLS